MPPCSRKPAARPARNNPEQTGRWWAQLSDPPQQASSSAARETTRRLLVCLFRNTGLGRSPTHQHGTVPNNNQQPPRHAGSALCASGHAPSRSQSPQAAAADAAAGLYTHSRLRPSDPLPLCGEETSFPFRPRPGPRHVFAASYSRPCRPAPPTPSCVTSQSPDKSHPRITQLPEAHSAKRAREESLGFFSPARQRRHLPLRPHNNKADAAP